MTRYDYVQKNKLPDGGTSVSFGPMEVRENGSYVRYSDALTLQNDIVLLKAVNDQCKDIIKQQSEEIEFLRGMIQTTQHVHSDQYDRLVRMEVNQNFTSK